MVRACAFLLLTLAALTLHAGAAKASFGDCTNPAYISGFGDGIEGASFTCVERFRTEISTSDGPRTIRIIQDAAADWAMLPGAPDEAERGARAAADAMPEIGSFHVDDITILLLDTLPPGALAPSPDGEIGGETSLDPGHECRIVFYLLGEGGRPDIMAENVAHEIFHCIQLGTLTTAQMTSGGGGTGAGGDWWLEGSAEWFAALALGEMGLLPDRIAEFERQVEAGTPLYGMDYGAVVFFMWLGGGEAGPTGVIPFLHHMADSPGAAAQRAAMRAALPSDAWQRFVQDYLDIKIKHPRDLPLPFSVGEGTTWNWDRSRDERIELQPFVLTRGRMTYECGRWRLRAEPSSVDYAVRPDDSRDWEQLPDEIDTQESDPDNFRFGAISTADRPQTLTVNVERLRSCESCGGTDEVDRCLAGIWQESGGGAAEWMRSQLPPGVSMPVARKEGGAIVLNEDGTYWTAPMSQRIVILARDRDGVTRTDGQGIAQATGRWSAKDGQLNMCQDSGGMTGNAHVTTPKMAFDMPVSSPSSTAEINMSYSCSEDSFSTSMDIPGSHVPMTTQYRKIGEEE